MATDCTALIAEIDAFYGGFGQPTEMLSALRSAVLMLPLTDDERVWKTVVGGIGWVSVFTSEARCASYLAARGESGEQKYYCLTGARVIDDVAASFGVTTGVLVDPCGDQPMAFPPENLVRQAL